MKTRPKGITILSILFWVSVPWYLVLAALRLFNRPVLDSILGGLSPRGAGPAEIHAGMGALQPVYYLVMAGVCAAVAVSLWRLHNWARYFMLAISIVSLVGVLASVTTLAGGATAGAIGLFALRVGLCVLWIWYLLSRGVRIAFSRHPAPA